MNHRVVMRCLVAQPSGALRPEYHPIFVDAVTGDEASHLAHMQFKDSDSFKGYGNRLKRTHVVAVEALPQPEKPDEPINTIRVSKKRAASEPINEA